MPPPEPIEVEDGEITHGSESQIINEVRITELPSRQWRGVQK